MPRATPVCPTGRPRTTLVLGFVARSPLPVLAEMFRTSPSMSKRTICTPDEGGGGAGRDLRLRRCDRAAVEPKFNARTDLQRKCRIHLLNRRRHITPSRRRSISDPLHSRVTTVLVRSVNFTQLCSCGWLGSRVVSVLDSGAEGPGFKSQPRRCRVTVLANSSHPSCLCSPSSEIGSSLLKGCEGNCMRA